MLPLTRHLRPDILVPLRSVKLLQYDLLLVRINHELFDILREHRQPLIFLRVCESLGKFDILWVDYHLLTASATDSRPRARLQPLRLVEPGSLLLGLVDCLLGEAHEIWTQYLQLLLRYLSPGILQDLFGRKPSFWRFIEEFGEEHASLGRDMVRELKILRSNVVIQLFVVLTAERELATEQGVKEDTQGPYICRWARILNLTHDFRGHVRWCPTENLDLPLVRNACTEAKIDHFDPLFRLI